MNKNASVNITIILTIAAILIVPLSVLQTLACAGQFRYQEHHPEYPQSSALSS